MEIETPAAALEREHREIDEAVTAFLREPADEGRRGGLRTALHELRHHIYLEEEYLFPALPDPALAAPVFVMLREHAQMWRLLDALEDAPRTRDDRSEAARLCKELSIQLQHHNQKEERILYAAAATTIPTELTGLFVRNGSDARAGTSPHWFLGDGMLHGLRQASPGTEFIPANEQAACTYMKMITLPKLRDALRDMSGVVTVPAEIAAKAQLPIERMVSIGRDAGIPLVGE